MQENGSENLLGGIGGWHCGWVGLFSVKTWPKASAGLVRGRRGEIGGPVVGALAENAPLAPAGLWPG